MSCVSSPRVSKGFASVHVSYRTMATHAGNFFTGFCRMRVGDRLSDFRMTFQASLFGDGQIAFTDSYRFVKTASGEVKRMPETVGGFGRVFADCVGRRVAIVAGRHCAMR